ncbi:ankyrin repeat domain-containing protein 49 [Galendromus occidentalis]|uniref:Ankyrin repeat domain-containing protein 49 n=1 Tax=Galendromus occidentalis TaxID=34638 RepID=A0AAJ6VYY4_9ACAR|nr:ankyrin repeat domain-containing protein 49 [Galendromus occidentalis]
MSFREDKKGEKPAESPAMMETSDGFLQRDVEESHAARKGSAVGEEDEVPELREGRFAQRMKKGKMWTSEDSYENDREVMRNNNPKEKALWAAEKNELELLQELVASDASLVHARDSDSYTPLHRASYSDNIEVIKLLLEKKADIEARTADGWTPLHCAARWDNVQSAAILIAAGANFNARTNGDQTALHLAASNREGRETLELLLWQSGLDTDKKNKAGDLAFSLATRNGNLAGLFEMVEPSVNCLRPRA